LLDRETGFVLKPVEKESGGEQIRCAAWRHMQFDEPAIECLQMTAAGERRRAAVVQHAPRAALRFG